MELEGKTLGERLKELRDRRGLLQSDICDKLNIGSTNYSKYENDQVVRPNPEIVKKFSDFYDIPVADLVKKSGPFDHLPAHIMNMVMQKDALPFLVETYRKYKEYCNEKTQM